MVKTNSKLMISTTAAAAMLHDNTRHSTVASIFSNEQAALAGPRREAAAANTVHAPLGMNGRAISFRFITDSVFYLLASLVNSHPRV